MDHGRVIVTLANVWGGVCNGDLSMYHTGRIYTCGIMTMMAVYQDIFERLTEGCTSRCHIDNPSFSLKQICQTDAFAFDNEKI